MIQISKFSYDNPRFLNILNRQGGVPQDVIDTVSHIIEDVRKNGDKALNHYMKKFDQMDLEASDILVSREEIEEAKKNMTPAFAEALKRACDNMMAFHKKQLPNAFQVEYEDGVVLERKYTPLKRVAVTVPGDMAPLLSTLYMNLVPAIVAGVPEIYVLSKPKNGKINDYLLFVADYLGIDTIYKISGAQGIAAVAYGTDRVKKVDAVMGPGNNYTQMAKKLLYGTVKIDSIAGPSEIVVLADDEANPTFVAADLLSQAEHGTGFEASTAFCLSQEKAEEIKAEVARLVTEKGLDVARGALDNYGDVFIVDSLDVAVEATNRIAPEHVEVLVKDVEPVVERITNAGTIFVGEYSPEPVGDYFCGTNHVLPTCGTARFSSGLSVLDFVRGYSVIRYTKEALAKNAKHIKELAGPEGMKAHGLSIEVREGEG